MSITTTDVVAEWGAYYRAEGQGQQDLINDFYQQDETSKILALQPTKKTVLEKASAHTTSVLQRYQKEFTPKGDTEFKPTTIPLYKIKIDWEEVPDDLEESWIGFLASNKLSRKDWPFIKYVIKELIMKKEIEDFENDAIYSGVIAAVTPGTATASSAVINGIRKQINDGITAGDVNSIVTGALDTDAKLFVAQVEDWWRQIPLHIRRHVDGINMGTSNSELFSQGMRETYNMNYDQATISKIIGTNVNVNGLASHEGESKIWTTVRGNAVLGVKKPENPGHFKVEEAKRAVAVMTDYYKGFGFWQSKWVYTNDQNLI